MLNEHHIEISFEEFIRNYSFINSLFSPLENFEGFQFGPKSFEMDFLRSYDPAYIWSKIINEDGDTVIISGFDEYEGIAFYISSEPVLHNTRVLVKLD